MHRDVIAWGPAPTGPRHHTRSKLTPAQREEIRCRRADGESARSLALEYKVSTVTIRAYSA